MEWVHRLLAWYRRHQRQLPWRDDPSPYRVWVSEIMLQQTRVVAVQPYFARFLDRFPSLESLAAADQEEVLKVWEGLGYYSRARNLHRAARLVVAERGGLIPATSVELAELPGVGPYTAAAIASIAFGEATPVVDGNVLRVVARHRAWREDIAAVRTRNRVRASLEEAIAVSGDPSSFNQAMMELGALVCTPRQPQCVVCPLAGDCRALAENVVAELPVKRKRGAVPCYEIAVGLVFDGELVFIARRGEDQMLGGLWEFPGGKREGAESLAETCIREVREEVGLTVAVAEEICTIDHAYSHFAIRLTAFRCRLAGPVADLRCERPTRWVRLDQLRELPFPKANHKIFAALGI
ncbi:MAG: A/G-specific adenine glycosylase [Lentisphaeria bacterium]|jgi:A/G-specific adenine glycosylase|nr:A/G-specific adenine glycosylase [Lentisphaeria bacterium]